MSEQYFFSCWHTTPAVFRHFGAMSDMKDASFDNDAGYCLDAPSVIPAGSLVWMDSLRTVGMRHTNR